MGKLKRKFRSLPKERKVLLLVLPIILIAVCCVAFFSVRARKNDVVYLTGTLTGPSVIQYDQSYDGTTA